MNGGTDMKSRSKPKAKEPQYIIDPYKASHSKVQLGRRCRKAYKYRYIDKLRKRVKGRALIVGGLVHECLESYFRNGSYLTVIKEWERKTFNKMFKEEKVLHADIIPLVKSIMRGYVAKWKTRDIEMDWVEKSFEVELKPECATEDEPAIVLIGKIDGKGKCSKNMRWLVEHKTCKKMPDEDVRKYDVQGVLYNAVLPLMGEEPVHGILWDYLRTKLPAIPKLLKDGSLSKGSIDTLASVYKRTIERHGLKEKDYKDIIKKLEGEDDRFYREIRLPFSRDFSANIIKEFIIDCELLIELERRYYEDNDDCFTARPTRDCSWCDFAPLCYAELRGEDTSYILRHDYEKSKGKPKKA